MKRIAIAGATGYLGSRLVKEACRRGYPVRALVRDSSRAGELRQAGAEIYVGKATEPTTLSGFCEGAEWVISSLGITRQRDGLSYADVDYGANRNVLDEALAAGVRKFAYVSLFRGPELRSSELVDAKERFVDELVRAPLASCVIRPTGFFSDMGDFLEMARKGRVFLFGDGMNTLNPIDGGDLATAILDALEGEVAELPIGGPETMTLREIGEAAFAALGKEPRITCLPDGIRRFALWILPKVTPQRVYGPVQFFLTGMALSLAAPEYGVKRLEEFFRKGK
ncbi:MAG: SDR family oxidoreductase [Spirochaetales bacterium]|nr:SDR family oxidoreductase [Spirochaetales bacterium]